MNLEQLRLELIEYTMISPENIKTEKNRYNPDLGTITISQRVPNIFLTPVLKKAYDDNYENNGLYFLSKNGDDLIAHISNSNNSTKIEISRNHLFNLTL